MTEHAPLATGSYPGIEVAYYEQPYRHYTVNGTSDHTWTVDEPWGQVASVTSAIGILGKDGLTWWAANTTAEAIWTLAWKRGYRMPVPMRVPKNARAYRLPQNVTSNPRNGVWLFKWADVEAVRKVDPASLIHIKRGTETLTGGRIVSGQIRQLGLDHNSIKKAAADLGTDVHKVWQDWNEQQRIPVKSDYPADRWPRIRALSQFILKYRPRCLESEQIVGSALHGFAGRLDTVVILDGLDGREGACMVDLKNSKAVYPNQHFPQLCGYEIARRECGLTPSNHQAILRLGADGKYELAWSDATDEDFLSVLAAWRSQQRWVKR